MLQECQDVLYKSCIFDVIFSLSNYLMFITQQQENHLIMVSKLHKLGWNWVSQINESYILAFQTAIFLISITHFGTNIWSLRFPHMNS